MKFYNTILRFPKSVIGIILLLTLFFGWEMQKVKIDNSIIALLPAKNQSVAMDNEVKKIFNSREMILIGVINNKGIFNPVTLQKVKDLTENIRRISIVEANDVSRLQTWGEKLGGRYRQSIDEILSGGITTDDRGAVSNLWVEAKNDANADSGFVSFLEILKLKLSPVSDIISLAEVDNITSTDWGLNIDSPMKTVPRTPEELAKLASTVFGNEMFINGLVSEDSTGTVLLIELSFNYDNYQKEASLLFQKLQALAAIYQGPEKIQLAGVPMVNIYTSEYMSRDLGVLTPIVILLVMIVMYLSFWSFKGVFLPLIVVLGALVWTMGTMGIFGRPITLVVTAMPVMLIAIGIADGIHLFSEYKLMWAKFKDRDKAILTTMKQLTKPVIFTSLTTIAGFASLATSSLQSIKDFGIFTSVGVFAAMVFSLTFIPAALKLMKPPKVRFVGKNGELSRLTRWLERFGDAVLRRRRWVLAGTITLAALTIIAISQLKVGSTMVGNFKEHSEIYQASQMLNSEFGGTEVMNIIVDTKTKNGLKDPELLAKIAALQDTLEANALVGYTTSIADYVKRINLVMNNNDPAFNRIPGKVETVTETEWIERNGKETEIRKQVKISGRDQIGQYILLYENAGGDNLEKLADYDYSKANIIVQIRTDDTRRLREIKNIVQRFALLNFGSTAEISYAGCSSLCVEADDLIIPSQTRSLGIALLVVFGLLTMIFRSPKYGLIGLLPMLLVILLAFAMMSVFGVNLDVGTALVASIVLGIGVDYSVHFLSRYRALRKEGMDFDEATRQTFTTSGRAIVFNSLAVAIGFLVLLLSSFWPVIHIGWLVSVNMIFSAILTMLLIPVLLMPKKKKKRMPDEQGVEGVAALSGTADHALEPE
ncbi:MAG: RND family transporter [Calditrichaeota bacterium]|nr:RND family transporter [Calditrichota bacterium]